MLVFERHGIHYSIEGGTAIGALRHQGLIPWDDDLDIGVLEEDEDKLLGPVSEDLSRAKKDLFLIILTNNFVYLNAFLLFQNRITALVGPKILPQTINFLA